MDSDQVTIRMTRGPVWHQEMPGGKGRWLKRGDELTLHRDHVARYESGCPELVAGTLKAPPPPRPPSFKEKMVTKVAEAAQSVTEAVTGKRSRKEAAPASPGEFPCPYCSQVFNAARGLEIHLKNAHPAEPAESAPEDTPETREA